MCARRHGASAPQVKAAIERRVEQAKLEKVAKRWNLEDVPVDEHPVEGLLREYRRTAAIVAYLDDLVAGVDRVDTYADKAGVARVSPEVEWWERERDRLARRAVELVKAGVEERRIRLAEDQGREMVRVLSAVIGAPELGLSAEQKRAAAGLIRERLPLLLAGS